MGAAHDDRSDRLTEEVADVRDRLALALDVDDLVEAIRLARELRPWFGVAKVGLELFSAGGPDAIGALADLGYEVFLDLKLHDIPTTVGTARRACSARSASTYLTMHAQGGVGDAARRRRGPRRGRRAARAWRRRPRSAVTILTSDDGAPAHILPKRVGAAVESGCGGIVCAAADVREAAPVRARGSRSSCPASGRQGTSHHDQARAATPGRRSMPGADLLVIGRAVTEAADPAAAAAALVASIA